MKSKKVIIIGGGLAGLTAAYRLQIDRPELETWVLEANSFPGGKIVTTEFGGEAGAEMAPSYYDSFINFSNEVGAPIGSLSIDKSFNRILYYWSPAHEWIEKEKWPEWKHNPLPDELKKIPPLSLAIFFLQKIPRVDLNKMFEEPNIEELSKKSLLEMLELLQVPKSAYAFIESNADVISDLSEISVLSCLMKIWQAPQKMDPTFYYIKGGSQALPAAIVKKIKNIYYEEKVCQVDLTAEKRYKVITEKERTFESDYVIFALPNEPFKKINLNPPLEGIQKKAIDRLTYSPAIKIFYKITTPYWKNGHLPMMWTDTDISMILPVYDTEYKESPISGSKVWGVCIVSCGRKAFNIYAMLEKGIPIHQYCQSILENILPMAKGCLEHVVTYDWGHISTSLGGFPFYPPDPNLPSYYKNIAKPSMGRYFAGEQTEYLSKGLNAAVASGIRAAQEVCRDFSNEKQYKNC